MAISILEQDGVEDPGANVSVSVTLTAGNGSRRMFVATSTESSTSLTAAVTYGGQSLTLVTDGTTTASQPRDDIAIAEIYELKETGLQAAGNGENTLSVVFGTPGDDHSVYWIILDGVDQGDADDVANGSTGTGTNVSASVTAATADSFTMSCAYKNGSDSSFNVTSPSEATTDQVNNGAGGGSEHGVAHKLGSLTVGSNTWTWNGTSANRHVLTAIVVRPFVSPVTTYDIAFNGDPSPDTRLVGDYNDDLSHGETDWWINPGPNATGPRVAQATATPAPARHSYIGFAISPFTQAIVDDITATAAFVGVGVSSTGAVQLLVQATAGAVGVGLSSAGLVEAHVQAQGFFVGVGVSSSGQVQSLVTAASDVVGVGINSIGLVETFIEGTADIVGVGLSSTGAVSTSQNFELIGDFVGVGISSTGAVAVPILATADIVGVGLDSTALARALVQATCDIVGVGLSSTGLVVTQDDVEATAEFVGVGIGSTGAVFSLIQATGEFVGVGLSSTGLVRSPVILKPVRTRAYTRPNPITRAWTC